MVRITIKMGGMSLVVKKGWNWMWSWGLERPIGERAISEWIRIMCMMDKKRIMKGEMMWIE